MLCVGSYVENVVVRGVLEEFSLAPRTLFARLLRTIFRYIEKLAEVLGDDEIVSIACTHRHRDHIGISLEYGQTLIIGGIEEVRALFGGVAIPVYKLKDIKEKVRTR